jgi:hypothetical protein
VCCSPEMPQSVKELKPIPPNPPRWKPSIDPASIIVTSLDTTASVNDQIDQIDQLITLKLQVPPTDLVVSRAPGLIPHYYRTSMLTFPKCSKCFHTEFCPRSSATL